MASTKAPHESPFRLVPEPPAAFAFARLFTSAFVFGPLAPGPAAGTGARGGSIGAGSDSPYTSSSALTSSTSSGSSEASAGTLIAAPQCLQRTVLPANFSAAWKRWPHWVQLKEMLIFLQARRDLRMTSGRR